MQYYLPSISFQAALSFFPKLICRMMPSVKVLLSCFMLLFAVAGQAQSTDGYIRKHRSLADSLGAVYGIPAAVILAVAVVESSSGTGRNCRLLNNHFGIVGRNNLMKTKKVKTRYKQYPNTTASYIDFCKLMTRKRFYPKLKGNKNWQLWITAISKTGYSEIPVVWQQRVSSVIKKHRLATATQ